jgi:hypothetical protein
MRLVLIVLLGFLVSIDSLKAEEIRIVVDQSPITVDVHGFLATEASIEFDCYSYRYVPPHLNHPDLERPSEHEWKSPKYPLQIFHSGTAHDLIRKVRFIPDSTINIQRPFGNNHEGKCHPQINLKLKSLFTGVVFDGVLELSRIVPANVFLPSNNSNRPINAKLTKWFEPIILKRGIEIGLEERSKNNPTYFIKEGCATHHWKGGQADGPACYSQNTILIGDTQAFNRAYESGQIKHIQGARDTYRHVTSRIAP